MINQRQNKSGAGFTLIELLIYITLVAFISVIFTSFVIDVVKNAGRAIVAKEVNQSARMLLARLDQEIKTGNNVTVVSPSQLTLTDYSGTTITLTFDGTADAVFYDNGSGPVVISNPTVRITYLSFNQISPQTIAINLAVEQKKLNPPPTQRYKLELVSTVIPRPQLY